MKYLFILAGLLVMGCTTKLRNNAKNIHIVNKKPKSKSCKFLGNILSSEGNYLTIEKNRLYRGALNGLKNKALEKGANVVYLKSKHKSTTGTPSLATPSGEQEVVTLIGQAYKCKIRQKKRKK